MLNLVAVFWYFAQNTGYEGLGFKIRAKYMYFEIRFKIRAKYTYFAVFCSYFAVFCSYFARTLLIKLFRIRDPPPPRGRGGFFDFWIFPFLTRDHAGSTQLREWSRFRTLFTLVEGN